MRHGSRNAVAAAVCLLCGVSAAPAQDWPQWRGPNRDDRIAGFQAPETWPAQLKAVWKVTVGAGDATPALVGDRLYVFTREGANEVLRCLDAASGKEIWSDKYPARAVTGAPARHPGPRSSPAVAQGKVITLGVGGVLSCLNAADGALVWRNTGYTGAVPQFFTGMSPIVCDDVVVAHLGGQNQGALVAFDLATGAEKWKWTAGGPSYSSPVLMSVDDTKTLLVQTERNLVGVGLADGKVLWQVATPAQRRFYNAATPIVDGTTVIFTGQGAGTRAIKVQKEGDGFAVQELWSNAEVGTGFNTPVLKDGLLYGLSDRGNLFCLRAADGTTAWTDATRRRNFGSVLDAGAVLLALPANGELLVFKPTDKAYEEVARYKVAEKEVCAHPVVAGRHIYVQDLDSIALWSLE